jgi:hypothetical protein
MASAESLPANLPDGSLTSKNQTTLTRKNAGGLSPAETKELISLLLTMRDESLSSEYDSQRSSVVDCADFLIQSLQDETVAPEIAEIETRTKDEIYELLHSEGIQKNSESWRDYARAKKLVFRGHWIDEATHEKQTDWIVEYLGLIEPTGDNT